MTHNVGLSRVVLSFCAAVVLLAGCGGSQGQVNPPAAVLQSAASDVHPGRADSKRARNAATSAFTVSGRKILLDGQFFFIKGVDYGNNQIDAYADSNPLDNANEPIWSPDLDAMRAAGVNAVKVYNVTLDSFMPYEDIIGGYNKLRPYETGKIDEFLKKAWNGGNHPIYVVLSIFFGGVNVQEPQYLNALQAVYKLMAQQYAADPAFMGISIGSEINSESFIQQPDWWRGLNKISASITAGYKSAQAQKILTTTMVDDGLNTVRAGEANGFKIDAWGLDVYRGRTMGTIWQEIKSSTQKPEIMAEYGASAAYYPPSTARYDDVTGGCNRYPPGTTDPPYYGLPPPRPWELATELPSGGNPRMDFLVRYVKDNATELFAHRADKPGGVGSGGFYFEWNDEWWKSGWPFKHIGGFEGNKIIRNAAFPGCYDDQAWFGLYADKKNGSGDPFPKRPPDTRVKRPTLDALKAVWTSEL